MKRIYIMLFCWMGLASCSDFLNTIPGNALSPDTFWKTEADIKLAITGCYEGWESGDNIFYRDCGSDNAFSFHVHEGWQVIGNGGLSSTNTGEESFSYETINKCNDLLANIDKVEFSDETLKERYRAEARFLRAYRYFILTTNFGDVPLSLKTYKDIEESRIPRTPKAEVEQFIFDELTAAAANLPVSYKGDDQGRVTKGAALAIKMRLHLYLEQYKEALAEAEAIKALKVYDLFPTYDGLFQLANEGNQEVILDVQYIENDYENWIIGAIMPNGDGGWSSIVPIQSLVDAYETKDGLTIQEAKALGKYDEQHPFVNRDPRLKQTILYAGQNWEGRVFDPLAKTINVEGNDVTNPDYPYSQSNASKTAYSLKKYIAPVSQYPDIWNTGMNIIVCRYAEVLLTIAEAKIELNQIDDEMYESLDAIRNRVGMPDVDRTKYNNQTSLRELLRRERRVELAMEGLRRADIIRWDIAKDVLNGDVYGCREGVVDSSIQDEDLRANLTGEYFFVEKRKFAAHNRYLPIAQSELDLNPNLTQTTGY
ncbi:RagB/SusD family nutrient uptake outer membrane protein [Bacteroides sp.]